MTDCQISWIIVIGELGEETSRMASDVSQQLVLLFPLLYPLILLYSIHMRQFKGKCIEKKKVLTQENSPVTLLRQYFVSVCSSNISSQTDSCGFAGCEGVLWTNGLKRTVKDFFLCASERKS